MRHYNRFLRYVLMEGASDNPPAGGGNPNPEPNKELEALKNQNADLLKRLEALEKSKPAPTTEPDDLSDKLRKEREEKERKANESKTLEGAIQFNLTAKDFFKTNEKLLPKTLEGILEKADQENYGSHVEKANAIKVSLVTEFFAQQENLDLLTANQKIELEDFKKLTKDIKGERVSQIYNSIFEPTFEAKKKIEKAKQVSSGTVEPDGAKSEYYKKMQALSRKHYLKEKGEN